VANPALPDSALILRGVPKKIPSNSPFGRRLTQLRMARGLTQIQLAELIDSTQRCISRYETIAEFPPAEVLVQLAQALDVSADELLGLDKPKVTVQPKVSDWG
jgi:transcriptional regulator with XRE-family HTH domain